jgi:uncharacterized protein CbrC (UPF0167 family)
MTDYKRGDFVAVRTKISSVHQNKLRTYTGHWQDEREISGEVAPWRTAEQIAAWEELERRCRHALRNVPPVAGASDPATQIWQALDRCEEAQQ